MDTELARTFLTVVASGSFSAAAARLFVTQSTVSTRIAALEDQLGCRLFVRNKGGALLTPQGRWFQAHATTLVRTVERVRQEIGVPRGFAASVTIGGRLGLWESLLLALLPRVRQEAPDVALRSQIGFEDDLMQGLLEGRLDIGVMYAPHQRPGLVVEPLFEEALVYVSTVPDAATVPEEGYVYVDWGPEFAVRHSATFPDYPGAALSVNVGWLGLQHILAHGGAGYFPLRLVGEVLARGVLHQRQDVPGFNLPAYVVHSTEPDEPTARLLDLVRSTARQLGADGAQR